jgi:FKBP-type peptidyl-prolyl cis-trans isomerase FkpA
MNRLPLLLCASLLLLTSACGPSGDPADETYAASLNVDLHAMNRSASGLYTQDLVVGTGAEATQGRNVQVHYTGWFPNGTMFDTSRDTTPFSFTLGQGRVIQGWEEGLLGMRAGGQRKLVIPSDLGYGDAGYGGIPGHQVLVFDVELVSVR